MNILQGYCLTRCSSGRLVISCLNNSMLKVTDDMFEDYSKLRLKSYCALIILVYKIIMVELIFFLGYIVVHGTGITENYDFRNWGSLKYLFK